MRMVGTRRGVALVGACVAVILSFTGCGGTGEPGQPSSGVAIADKAPADLAREAPDVTRAAGSSRFALNIDYTSTGGPLDAGGAGNLSMTGEGTYDFARQIGDGEYTSSGGLLSTERQEVVFRNNVLYQRAPGQSRWQEWDFSDLVNTPVGQHDPSQQLNLLRGVSDDVREVGPTQVRGADVRHYAITIDPVRLAQHSGVVVDGGLTQAALQAAGAIPADVFVDGDGRVRRLELRIAVSGADIAAASPETAANPELAEALRARRTESRIAVEFFDFGVPVTAQVPDPSLVDPPSIPMPPR